MTLICLVFAFVLFILSAASRWWAVDRPYYPSLLSLGLAFWILGAYLLPAFK